MRMILLRLAWFAVTVGLVGVALPAEAGSKIYSYTDENGVTHFTNQPVSGRFRPHWPARKGSQRRRVTYEDLSAPFEKNILTASKRYGVHADLIRSVILAESSFKTYAVSRKGAMGLMQLMPGTAEDMKLSDPFNPSQNILAGTRYLKKMLRRFRGDLNLSLAAYNCGPETVTRYGGVPPYRETREYVSKVTRYFRWYQSADQ